MLAKVDNIFTNQGSRLCSRHITGWGEIGGSDNISVQLVAQLGGRKGDIESSAIFEEIVRLWRAGTQLDALSKSPRTGQSEDLHALLGQLVEHGSMVARQSLGDTQSCQKHVETALCSLQEKLDTWLIRELIGLDGDMIETPCFGYVVPLRSFSLLPVKLIDTDRAKWYQQRNHYLRICRLRGLYKSDLIQKFANLFVRVGLEDYRVEDHRRAFKRCAQSLFPVKNTS